MKKIVLEESISNKLNVLIALQLASMPEEYDQASKVRLLSRLGVSNAEIADILGTSKGAVGVIKYRNAKRRSKDVNKEG